MLNHRISIGNRMNRIGTSDALKVLKIARAVGSYTSFIYYVLNKITQTRYFVRARILPVLGLVFFQSSMFARHSTRSV